MSEIGDWLRSVADLCDANPDLRGVLCGKAGPLEFKMGHSDPHLNNRSALFAFLFSAKEALKMKGAKPCPEAVHRLSAPLD